MKIVIINYGSGNLKSVENALKNALLNNNWHYSINVTNDLHHIKNSDFILLPGVGAFPDCKQGLLKTVGLIETLYEQVINKSKPFLGICVGMQLMVDKSLEKSLTFGFGWLKGTVERINCKGVDYLGRGYKIPHIGWNNLEIDQRDHPLMKNINQQEQFYFVHSYYIKTEDRKEILASTKYGHTIPAVIGKDNFVGVQFHPEKSSNSGQKFLSNWLSWKL